MSQESYEANFAQYVANIESYLGDFWQSTASELPGVSSLIESMKYSFKGGGKRFRPVLSQLTAVALNKNPKDILAFAASVEMVHTYSLIHDDLPCMDDDSIRRGIPTNHKVFGEATALLAGDALQSLAIQVLADEYNENPRECLKAIQHLSKSIGIIGMVGGQALDMFVQGQTVEISIVERMHRLKTGALIETASVGAAYLLGANDSEVESLRLFSSELGLAFQVADDLLDHDESAPEPQSFTAVLGVKGTQDYLHDLSSKALHSLEEWDEKAEGLRQMVHYNLMRLK